MIFVADSGNLDDVAEWASASNVNFVLVFIWHCYVISPIPRLLEQVATWPFDEFIPSHASIVNVTNMGLIRRADWGWLSAIRRGCEQANLLFRYLSLPVMSSRPRPQSRNRTSMVFGKFWQLIILCKYWVVCHWCYLSCTARWEVVINNDDSAAKKIVLAGISLKLSKIHWRFRLTANSLPQRVTLSSRLSGW